MFTSSTSCTLWSDTNGFSWKAAKKQSKCWSLKKNLIANCNIAANATCKKGDERSFLGCCNLICHQLTSLTRADLPWRSQRQPRQKSHYLKALLMLRCSIIPPAIRFPLDYLLLTPKFSAQFLGSELYWPTQTTAVTKNHRNWSCQSGNFEGDSGKFNESKLQLFSCTKQSHKSQLCRPQSDTFLTAFDLHKHT